MPETVVICLMGATATGKTDLALEIAGRFEVEIVSVDSALVYRHMDIGTAKPSPQVLAEFPHHLVDILDPAEAWSAWSFVEQCTRLVREIARRGRIPLLVGGSMLYFHALEQGLDRLPEADAGLRRRLDHEARERGWPALHARLADIDAASAARIKPSDAQRIQRALEVYELTGEPLSALQRGRSGGYPGQIEKIILGVDDRAALHRRIAQRFDAMLRLGFIDEVERLRARGDLDLSLPSMRAVGYRQIWRYLDGEIDRERMVESALAATRQLAKRQLTWLRKQPSDATFDCLHYRKDDIFRVVESAIHKT